jgi:hypothetical protein
VRAPERGAAILTTMIIVVVLLAGGGVLIALQLASTRSTDVTKTGISAMHCAESGLIAGRSVVEANYAAWSAALCNPAPPRGTGTCVIGSPASEPMWLRAPAVPHDLDGDGNPDFVLTLVDNDDESPSDLNTNSDQEVQIISTCIMYPEVPAQVTEHVRYDIPTGKLVRKLWLQTK